MKVFFKIVSSLAALVFLWQVAYWLSDYSNALFPSPLQTLEALVEMVADGSLLEHITQSMYRFVVGYVSAVVIAVLLGLFLGRFLGVFEYVNPSVQLLRPISPTAWMPFVVLLFGIGDLPAIVIIFIAAFFPVLLSTVSAVKSIDPVYFKVAKNFGIKGFSLFSKIIFPAAFSGIMGGIHLAIGTAWIFLVAGEMVGAQSGLGYLIIDARNNIRADILLATIVTIGVIGIALDSFVGKLERIITKK